MRDPEAGGLQLGCHQLHPRGPSQSSAFLELQVLTTSLAKAQGPRSSQPRCSSFLQCHQPCLGMKGQLCPPEWRDEGQDGATWELPRGGAVAPKQPRLNGFPELLVYISFLSCEHCTSLFLFFPQPCFFLSYKKRKVLWRQWAGQC